MDKNIPTILTLDEAITLGGIEPFYYAGFTLCHGYFSFLVKFGSRCGRAFLYCTWKNHRQIQTTANLKQFNQKLRILSS